MDVHGRTRNYIYGLEHISNMRRWLIEQIVPLIFFYEKGGFHSIDVSASSTLNYHMDILLEDFWESCLICIIYLELLHGHIVRNFLGVMLKNRVVFHFHLFLH
jgi:hypothetical protein